MIALSIRQPWAWLIVNGYKDVENRTWSTPYRGEFLVHAGMTCTVAQYDEAMLFVEHIAPALVAKVPALEDLPRGGIVGKAVLIECVAKKASVYFKNGLSPWFVGSDEDGVGFVLRNGMPLPFRPWKGRLQFFNVPDHEGPNFGKTNCYFRGEA
jgi:ASCH domain